MKENCKKGNGVRVKRKGKERKMCMVEERVKIELKSDGQTKVQNHRNKNSDFTKTETVGRTT